jgi:PhoH-like ATPase
MPDSESISVVTELSPRTKLFVLDTNVLMHDPTSLFRFEEHDIYIPMATLEELDAHKKGMSEVARNARQASRFLDAIVSSAPNGIEDGIELAVTGNTQAGGRLFLQTAPIDQELPVHVAPGKVDNQIIGVVKHLQETLDKRDVILVSKDINMRIKAHALGLAAEDYLPGFGNCPMTSGTPMEKAWNRGRRQARPTTASTAPCAPTC